MTIPTRIIEQAEFTELMKQEGDVLPLFKLTALPFDPPRPGPPEPNKKEPIGVNVLLLNVSEPCIYKDHGAHMAFVLIPGYDSETWFTYQNFQDCHIVKGAWAYRLAPAYWEESDPQSYDLEDAIYRFDHGPIEEWRLGN